MRCPRCGNDNPATNRFCGMCGATLLQAEPPLKAETPAVAARPSLVPGGQTPAPAAAASSQAASPGRAASPFSDDVREQISSEVPAISGPSFLGLNDPAPATRRGGSLSIDPSRAPGSRSLDYLLEDDDEPKSGGAWKFVLMVVALALAVGFGYLRWKNQGLPPWVGLIAHKPAAAPSSDAADSNSAAGSNAPATAPPSSAPATSPTDAGPSAPSAAPSSTQGSAASPGANPAVNPAVNPSANTLPANPQGSAPAQTQGTGAAAAPAQTNPTPTNSTPAPGDAADSGSGSGTGAAPSSAPAAAADTAQPDSAPAKPAPKPRPVVAPVRVDQVAEARKYLYGQGAPQNCDRGLHLLKPLADQSNPKAMIEMGALYSAGLCTPRDLPTAYRWFALALRKDPANQPLQGDLQKLWGEMTQPERQLAIKLSQ